jgi:hypothetical protein
VIPQRDVIFESSDPLDHEIWLSVDDLVSLGRARRKVLVNIASGKWVSREAGVGRNGKPVRLVLLSSLPLNLQHAWHQKHSSPATRPTDIDEPANISNNEALLTIALRRYEKEEREAFLGEAQRLASIIQRYDAIEIKRIRSESGVTYRYEFAPAVFALCKEAICTDELVLAREPRRAQCPSPHTLDGWSRRFKRDGLLTFLRLPGTSAGAGGVQSSVLVSGKTDRRAAVISAEAVEWVNENWRSQPTARALYKKLQKLARKHGWTIPSESWIYRKWKALPKPVKTLVLKGEKAYVSTCAPYVPRDYSDVDALQILVGDHSQRDVTVRLRDGSLARPWLTLWQCLRTGLLWGWHLDLTPSSRTAGLAYANGVRTFGAQPLSQPGEGYYSYLYTDQGKDYKSKNIDGKVIEVHKNAMTVEGGLEALRIQRRVGLVEDLGLLHLLARGYNAREKPIERTHRVISDWEQSTFEIEYCGRDAKNKPDAWHNAYERHAKLLRRAKRNCLLLNDSPFMSLDDYRDALTGFIAEYNHTEHERTALGGALIVPLDEFQRLYTTHYTISEEALALFLMKAEPRKVEKDGVWLHQRNWWYLNPAMWEYKGHQVEVRYSEDDYSRCWVVTPDGKIIEAQLVTPSTILNPNKATLSMIKATAAHERKVIREFSFITQSQIRGETVVDRAAALIEPREEAAEAIAVAGGSNNGASIPPAHVHSITRMDHKKIRIANKRTVTARDVSTVTADADIFRPSSSSRVKEFDFDE